MRQPCSCPSITHECANAWNFGTTVAGVGLAKLPIYDTLVGSMRHVISALVQNAPGVLSHISGMLASRGYNIDSLAVGETENPKLSRMTFVVVGDEKVREQVLKQLQKLVTVVKVDDITDQRHVERDLMLMRVEALPGARSRILDMVNIFRAKVVDVSDTTMMIEISGSESKLAGFIEAMRPFGIIELVRSGIIALPRG
jgi:acetolactate synthase-1/3 small subunit